MTTAMPTLETERLTIRPFTLDDLDALDGVLNRAWDVPPEEQAGSLVERERWLRWTVSGYRELGDLFQPPYGDRAVVRREDGLLIGAVGLVPSLGPFGQLPGFPANGGSRRKFPEVGLFWAIDPACQGQGYATEAGRALVDYGFTEMQLGRIVATTERTNARSMGVMRKLGMRILDNPEPEPEWFQIVGVLERS